MVLFIKQMNMGELEKRLREPMASQTQILPFSIKIARLKTVAKGRNFLTRI